MTHKRRAVVTAYAKINLTLDVFSLRPDGYHGIASVMQTISLHDTLVAERCDTPGIQLICDAPDEPTVLADESNLAWRAAAALLEAAELPPDSVGIRLHLTKRVPAQAGLGGGSSDAAAALRAVAHILDCDIGEQMLADCAAKIGSDVPFFLMGGAVVARGRGEKLTPLPDIAPFWMVVVKPDEGVSTDWAYRQLDSIPNRTSHRATDRMARALSSGDSERVLAWQCNDFELPIFQSFPRLAWLHDELIMAGASSAHLCGSGSALYGVAADEPSARKIASMLSARYSRVFVAHTIPRLEAHAPSGDDCAMRTTDAG